MRVLVGNEVNRRGECNEWVGEQDDGETTMGREEKGNKRVGMRAKRGWKKGEERLEER